MRVNGLIYHNMMKRDLPGVLKPHRCVECSCPINEERAWLCWNPPWHIVCAACMRDRVIMGVLVS